MEGLRWARPQRQMCLEPLHPGMTWSEARRLGPGCSRLPASGPELACACHVLLVKRRPESLAANMSLFGYLKEPSVMLFI